MTAPQTQALASHLIEQTLSSISLLESLSIIQASDAAVIRSKLPSPSGPFPSLSSSPRDMTSSFSQMNMSSQNYPPQSPSYAPQPMSNPIPPPPSLPPRSQPPESRAKALWDYGGTEPDDLAFRAGDTVIIDEEVNQQWYRGRVIPNGQMYPLERQGLFPSNYVEKLGPNLPPPQYQSPPPIGPNAMVQYQPPGPPQQYNPYDKPPQGQMIPQPPPGQVVVQGQGQGEQKPNKYGKIGSTLGHSAVQGFGFGAGASIAGNIVNHIF